MAAETSGSLLDSVGGMIARFADVATASPEQALLLVAGALVTGFSVAVFGYLAGGAAIERSG